MAERIHRFPNLARFGVRDIKQFALRELNGDDELAAAQRAGAGSGGAVLQRELLAEAIAEVNDETVTRPYYGWKKWSSKTLDFVRNAHVQINSVGTEDMDRFFAEFFPAAEKGLSDSASSSPGSESPGT